jgi:gliding motility-associated-like protein
MIITYQKLTADAGSDQEICANETSIAVTGSITGLTDSVFWSSDGFGSFESPNQLITSYIIGKNDLEMDSVTLTLTHVGICSTVTDQVTIFIKKLPEISAGTDFTVCSSGQIELNGTAAGNFAEAFWVSTGDGNFSPDNTGLEATYVSGSGDIAAGYVDLKLIVNSSNGCNSIEDEIRISFNEEILVEAGPDQQICADTKFVTLEPAFSAPVDSIKWLATGDGAFTVYPITGNAIYFPSKEDLNTSKITITLQAFSGFCPVFTDSLTLYVEEPFTVEAGPDLAICRDSEFIQLNAISNRDPITSRWITNGTGKFIPDENSLSAQYQFDAGDYKSDQIYLVIESEGTCNSASDTLVVSFYPEVNINAGNDITVCYDDVIELSGVSSLNSFEWSTSGKGMFIPNKKILNPVYIPNNQDIENGYVNIILSVESATCGLFSDTINISIMKNVILDAGDDQFVCMGDETQVLIEGNSSESLTEASTITFWETLGTGTFSNDSSVSVNIYAPSEADFSAGIVGLVFRSVSNYSCRIDADTTYIRFVSPPEVNAGDDFAAQNNEFEINGFVDNGSFVWETMGTGSFPGGENTLSTTYNASEFDILQGSVTLTLSSTLDNCPVVSDSVRINLSESLTIPNAFTPDGDGINDRFLDGIDKVIFNRWGQVIYDGNAGWDGKVKGVNASQGTYFYQIKGEYPAETPYLKGSVTLIRQN